MSSHQYLLNRHHHNLEKHPHFGHTITNDSYGHQLHPLSLHAPVVHVKATIVKVYPDRERRGAMHQHFDVKINELISIKGAPASLVDMKQDTFVAIRYGDHMGLAEPISGIAEGQEIELQGEYIDHGHAYATEDNRDRSPVIHFTHRPVGYVIYQGKEYH
ncbi:hypothetical protein M5X00_18585 [Paenibacillus alvei]|uniref:Uncharacterized protein n=1 Tax=Paenibacillus alvei TaxID=44250 RepID=A0ABT4H658_PAEAL|nr:MULTISPECIES: hypothetical protein [Paenibacillus]EJW15653.1 hypothetical protein PAV_7c00260 [Paenibacillus alvei DSM 29]MCY9541890.1 hypothetical protein [Paenibacillus alvei]MCY9707524.1 hypothetical protein [Paenibacillus alvei]MCY9734077.1 hypothetical protein [Paenibacillus alvei]MCY9756251.1 hypothetical protein [Paenibacillus alvei]